ncbi:MAG TPA: zinc ribbon domain-containing protein [Thermoanaerobaculia bacterium]|nr:zinc ribbon domain-containing protein [Thermoanaerobaculia bacterium]
MRCPECHANNEAGAAACSTCGLLLFKALPKRRAEDFAVQKRRESDRDSALCQYCSGEIAADAIRCRHCSEIVNDQFYRERARRIRGRINYASWIAYLFGLGALLLFRPVGLLSIAAGLLLSIGYYAIPVEPPQSRRRKALPLGKRLRRQFRMERVAIPVPHLRNKKLVFVGTPLVAALIGYSANLFLLQEPINDVLKDNAAFHGMSVSAHYEYWVVPNVVVYDLEGLSFRQTPIDVHTALLEFAKKLKAKRYSRVDLSYRGVTKYSIDGASFQRLGVEYAKRNLDFVLYQFPKLFRSVGPPETSPPGSGRDALIEFHRHWYGSDPMTRSVANGL